MLSPFLYSAQFLEDAGARALAGRPAALGVLRRRRWPFFFVGDSSSAADRCEWFVGISIVFLAFLRARARGDGVA